MYADNAYSSCKFELLIHVVIWKSVWFKMINIIFVCVV